MLFFQASEIEVGEDIAEKNQAAILIFLQNAQCIARAAHVRAEVQIRKDQRVIALRVTALRVMDLRGHGFYCRRGVLLVDELATIARLEVTLR